MEILTRDFGEIQIEKDDIITFPQGLPGFVGEKRFVFLPLDEESPFIVMQSVEEPELAFMTMEPGNIVEGYEFEIDDAVEKSLKLEGEHDLQDILVLSITTLKEEIKDITINLAAPVVINLKAKLGRQVILEKDYPVKYRVFSGNESLKQEKVTG